MEISDSFRAFESYPLWLVVIGLGILASSGFSRLLSKYPLSLPIVLLGLGYAAVALPLGLDAPDPLEQGVLAEHLTEMGVIVALMGAGLSLDRPPGLRSWSSTWRLLGITMILSIVLVALVGFWVAGVVPVSAMLLGAVIAPTDPVLASDVHVGPPGEGENSDSEVPAEDEVRFALTSEAGLNDGLAFPFTNMAIAMALFGAHPSGWVTSWLLIDVIAKIAIALVAAFLLGHLLSRLILSIPSEGWPAKMMVGLGSLAATFIVYGTTEYFGGYGFIAVFVAAVIVRNNDLDHHYHEILHVLIEKAEHLLTVGILIALGGAAAGSLFAALTWPHVFAAVLIVLVVRPVAGIAGMVGLRRVPWRERLAISFFGIRGIGSLYYLAFALNRADFEGARELWALVGLIVVISIVLHGVTASPITNYLDRMRTGGGTPLPERP